MQQQESVPPLSLKNSPEDSRIDILTKNMRPYIRTIFKEMAQKNPENTSILVEFLLAEQTEMNIKESTMEWKIKVIIWFCQFLNHKPFKEIAKQDVLLYLNKLRKPEADDPTHKWIGTYNNRVMLLTKFFKWLYNPDEPDYRKRPIPPCMNGVKQLPRKEKSSYQPSDLWTKEEHALFLKYCPSKRDRCYHAMAYDTSARPHELLKLRIKDIRFKTSPDSIVYAEILVSGKTKPRTLPLINSIPYLKEWIQAHPTGNNPESLLFVTLSDKSKCNPLLPVALAQQYREQYQRTYFPRLLDDPSLPLEDKATIKGLLGKKWNPYAIRHSALTAKSQILREATLRDHAGWTMTSKMPSVYLHYFGTESSNSLLEAAGILKTKAAEADVLRPKVCTNCNEPNTHDAKFCLRCRMVLTYEALEEVKEIQRLKDEDLQSIKLDLQVLKSLYKKGVVVRE